MNGLNRTNNNGVSRRESAANKSGVEVLARLLTSKKFFRAGVLSAACLIGGAAFAQDSAVWTDANGRVVELSLQEAQTTRTALRPATAATTTATAKTAKSAKTAKRAKKARRANPIRQTQALTPAADDSALDLSAPLEGNDYRLDAASPLSNGTTAPDDYGTGAAELLDGDYDAPLEGAEYSTDSEFGSEGVSVDDPNAVDASALDPKEDALDSIPTQSAQPIRSAQPEATAPTEPAVPLATRPATPAQPKKQLETLRPSALEPARGGSRIVATQTPAQRSDLTGNDYYGSISAAPNASNNPYARIGQAEYNPNQFYGAGSYNRSVNGYRNTPPVAAFGQNLNGEPCVDECGYGCEDGCCGYCGGLFQNLELGLDAFSARSPLDFEDDGSAGGSFSINWGSSRPMFAGLHTQVGARVNELAFDGKETNGFVEDDARTQFFGTAGVYFRAPSQTPGWSAGIVFDKLSERYYRKYDLSQLRVELSRNLGGWFEVGFRGAFSLDEKDFDFLKLDEELTVAAKAKATSYYTMFLRKQFANGAVASFAGGGTEYGEGLVSASAEAPLCDSFAIRGGFTYVIPTERGLGGLKFEQNWNASCGLVWRIGGTAQTTPSDSNRPLFEVADNGSFLQDFRRDSK